MKATFNLQTLSPSIGIEIRATDLSNPFSPDALEELRYLFDTYHLVVFRDQQITPEDQVRVIGALGPVSDENGDGVKYSYVSNVRPDGLLGSRGLPFHSDFSFTAYPSPVLSLYGAEIKGEPEPTTYVNTARACANLPEDLRTKLGTLTAMHVHDYSTDGGRNPDHGRVKLLELPQMPPYATHPRITRKVVFAHPRTGKQLLGVSQFHTSHIEGLGRDESEAIIQDLFARLYADDNLYTHRWRQGDLVIWDNIAVQHGRKPFQGLAKAATRTLCRVCVNQKSVVEIMEGVDYNSTGGFKVMPAQSMAQ